MGCIVEITTMEELEALMCDNVLPPQKYQEAFYRLKNRDAQRMIMYATEIYILSGGVVDL